MDLCLQVLKERNSSRFNSYSVRNRLLIISHITFRDCRLHSFSDNLSQNISIRYCWEIHQELQGSTEGSSCSSEASNINYTTVLTSKLPTKIKTGTAGNFTIIQKADMKFMWYQEIYIKFLSKYCCLISKFFRKKENNNYIDMSWGLLSSITFTRYQYWYYWRKLILLLNKILTFHRTPDLIVEVAHPSITVNYGEGFLDVADYMVGAFSRRIRELY